MLNLLEIGKVALRAEDFRNDCNKGLRPMRTSFRELENRLSRLERRLDPPAPCNCRLITRFHDANCLAAILEKTERKCPVHGFREMGSLFMWSPQYPLVDEDKNSARALSIPRDPCSCVESLARYASSSGRKFPGELESNTCALEATTRNEISGSGEPGGSCPASRRSGTLWPDDIANVTDNRSCH